MRFEIEYIFNPKLNELKKKKPVFHIGSII